VRRVACVCFALLPSGWLIAALLLPPVPWPFVSGTWHFVTLGKAAKDARAQLSSAQRGWHCSPLSWWERTCEGGCVPRDGHSALGILATHPATAHLAKPEDKGGTWWLQSLD
jgi:hypothetical protein